MPEKHFRPALRRLFHLENKSKSQDQASSRNKPAPPTSKQHPDTAGGPPNVSDPIPTVLPQASRASPASPTSKPRPDTAAGLPMASDTISPVLSQASHAAPATAISLVTSIWDEAYAQFKGNHPEALETFEAFLTRPDPAQDDEMQAAVEGIKNAKDIDRFRKIVEVLNKKEEAVNNARWKFKWGENEIVMREKVKQVADKILLAKDFIGQLANNEPHAAVVWAGIATLLPLLTNPALQAVAAINGLDFISELVLRYRLIEKRYFPSPEVAQRDVEVQELTSKAREKMVDIYSQIFGYVIRLSIRYCTNRFFTVLRDTVKADDWSQLLDQIQGDVESADEMFKALNREFFHQTLEEMQDNMGQMQTAQIKIGLATRLEVAKNATYNTSGLVKDFDSPERELYCLPGTRESLIRTICDWADELHGSMFLWLHGSAGTGKSTILRTVAQNLDNENRLGGSFFFKRGGGDTGVSTKLFTTLATQLAQKIPDMEKGIADALDRNSQSRSPQQQFQELLLQPLLKSGNRGPRRPTFFLVMDALDECQSESGPAGMILECLAQLHELPSCRIRILFTSRPDPWILRKAHALEPNALEERDLEEEQKKTIEADIELFLNHRFKQMREDPNNPSLANADDWPGEKCIRRLRDMAVPLFIFASTVCRYVAGPGSRKTLNDVLENSDVLSSGLFALNEMYRVILDQLVNHSDPDRRKRRIADVLTIVGSIALLSSPLPKAAAAELIGIPKDDLTDQLPSLASVLRVPEDEDAPLQLYHLSFRDFLVSNSQVNTVNNSYHVDEADTHGKLTARCLGLLENVWTTRDPVCSWKTPPGTLRSSVDRDQIDRWIKPEIAYASSYWVEHLKGSRKMISDCGPVHGFLRANFLHWLEALAWLGRLSTVIDHINDLVHLVDEQNSTELLAYLQDAHRFVLRNRYVVDLAPQQAYTSALIFAPNASVIRQHFCETYRDKWPRTVPKVPQDWSLEAQKLEGHETDVRAVAFSDDNQMIATGSADGTIKLWDAKSGEEKHNLIGHKDCVRAVVFLPSGTLVSGSYDKTLRFWDTGTGKELKKIQAHDDYILTLALSPLSPSSDSQLLASGSMDTTIKIWDSETGAERQRLMGHGQSQWVQAVAFSPLLSITQMLASASSDKTVRLWDIETGVELRKMEGHKDVVNAVAFSFNGELLASASDDKTIRLWSTQTGNAIRELEGHSDRILAVALSPSPHGTDGSQVLVSASVDKSIKLWNTSTGKETGKLEGHDLRINDIAFSASGTMLASVSDDATCRLWDMNLCGRPRKMEGHSDSVMGLEGVIRVIFSSDGQVVLSVSTEGNVIRTWSFQTGVETNHFEDHTGGATCFRDVTFSPDGQTLATISFDETVRIWDVGTGNEKHKLEYRFDSWPGAIAFSPNGKMLAAIVSMENDILIWDTKTGNLSQAQKYSCSVADGLLFSPDSRLLTAVPGNGEPIELLDLENGKTRKLKGSQGSCTALAFSPNSRYLASASTSIGTIRLWDTKTGREKHSFQDKETEEGSDLHWSDSEPESEGLDGTLVPEGVDSELEIEGVDGASDLEDDEIRALAFSPDGKLLVLASNGRPVRLWDVESREFVQDHLGNNDYAVTLSSSGAIASLSDSTGYSLTEHISCSDYNGSLEAHATTILQIEDQWLRYLGKDVLWLPQEFRGLCWSTSGHKIAIGQRSGSVSFFQFR